MARSGGIPKMSPAPYRTKAFSRDCSSNGSTPKRRRGRAPNRFLSYRQITENNGDRDSAWEELPVAVSTRMVRRDPSIPRHRFLMDGNFRGAPVGMTG